MVVGRSGDRDLVADRPAPPAGAYLGWAPEPLLDGWAIHRDVFATLGAVRARLRSRHVSE